MEIVEIFGMVSTRGVKYKFSEGEKVLCYEPDPTKAKVLYDSKVLGVVETKDKKGKKIVQYKIHFQGWNSSWDRRVNADFVLKDTEENRQLQKDLAAKAQLQPAAYLYRRESKNRNRTEASPKIRNRGSSEDGSSCSTFERNEREYLMRDECDSESGSSSIDSTCEEERVYIQPGYELQMLLNYDREMIVKNKKEHILPCKVPAVTILEKFVKDTAAKLVLSGPQNETSRRRNSQLRSEKREINLEKIRNNVSLLKETADGLRIYLNFILRTHLLYKEEKEHASYVFFEENLKNFTYIPSEKYSFDISHHKPDTLHTPPTDHSEPHPHSSSAVETTHPDDSARRRLRSFRNDEGDGLVDSNIKQDNYLSSVASTSSGGSTPHTCTASTNLDFIKSMSSLQSAVPVKAREFLQEVFTWQILPSNAEPEASMIYGAVHLARLIVKLPDFLNMTPMSDQKLALLVQHLDSFIKYLENHKEWFGEHNYRDITPIPATKSPTRTTEK